MAPLFPQWTDRNSGAIELDRILMPDDMIFKRVATGREGDRVYMVKYSSGAEPIMFWMQEKADSHDLENCNKVNEYANNPAAAAAAAAAASGGSGAPIPGAGEMDSASDALSTMLASLGLPGAPGAPLAARQPLTAEAFRSLMAGAGAGAGTGAGAGAGASSSSSAAHPSTAAAAPPPAPVPAPAPAPVVQAETTPPIELQEVLTADAVLATGLLDDPDTCASLIAQLPEGQRTRAHLEAALRSPQLADSMRALSAALQSENYNAVMANFGLDPAAGMSALMRGQAVEAFLNAVAALSGAGADNHDMDAE